MPGWSSWRSRVVPIAAATLVPWLPDDWDRRGLPPARARKRVSHLLRCESANAHQGTFTERLQKETSLLLARQLGAASLACPAREALEGLRAPLEFLTLFDRIDALVAAVDSLQLRHLDSESTSVPLRSAYSSFLEAVVVVESALVGAEARPLAETQAFAPLVHRWRYFICSLYSWGLLPEETAAEVAACLKSHGVLGVIDPLAGSGWHARLWRDAGKMKVVAMDSYPIRPIAWVPVDVVSDAREVKDFGIAAGCLPRFDEWALHLSWPPHSPETVGVDLLHSWPGQILIYLGERQVQDFGELQDHGLTGGQELLAELEKHWEALQSWEIPRWPGYSDDITVYRRRQQPRV